MTYQQLLQQKRAIVVPVGFELDSALINDALFPFQRDIVRWAVRKGRAAIFADTGLGKTAMQVEWARLIGGRALILTPLSVALQTVDEAHKLLGVEVHYTRGKHDLANGINITNYEMLDHFDAADFQAVVLDESSILKSLDGKTRRQLTEMFAGTPYRLACTATPAPNDITEIGRHAEFLGVMTNAEMLAAFFINDMKQKDGTYRLKRHAVKKFYRWLASWAMAVKKPSDLGYGDEGYELPPLNVTPIFVDSDYTPEGMLPGFGVGAISATESKRLRRETIEDRIVEVARLANGNDEQWVIWTGLNDEAEAVSLTIPDSVNVHGAMTPDEKAASIRQFVNGDLRVLVTKTSIAGFGINMQRARCMIFCGIDYSWESYYQAVRRMYRFGQTRPVNVYIVLSKQEEPILNAIMEKEREAIKMTDELISHATRYEREELVGIQSDDWQYQTDEASGDMWRLLLGDSAERITEIPENSVDLSVFSPPFISLYTYTPTERDMGNSRNADEFFAQFGYIIDGLLRITKSGRNCCVHVQQVAAFKATDGYIGIKDFRGDVIRAFQERGWVLHGEVTIDKDPQVQAIRTKAKGLMFVQLHKDSAANRPAFADYLLIFQKPGENAVPVVPDVTNEEWIQWARPVWYNVRETNVLNVAVARSEEDERHICPLQLDFIERCIRLYTNRDETVFDPFAGIGSTLHEAIRHGRRGLGVELKPEYFRQAVKNIRSAERAAGQLTLFSYAEQAANSD
jgi:DNA modification methylase/superfamily II DNA or RNA helicase